MQLADAEVISAAFARLGWQKPASQYQRYVAEERSGSRLTFLATSAGEFVGYVTLLWQSAYAAFAEQGIPEISDLNVLPAFRRQGIASMLLETAEAAAARRSFVVGLGVGLGADYGAAQRIYVRRGYVPDGRGVMYNNEPVEPGATVRIDDDATLMLTRKLTD